MPHFERAIHDQLTNIFDLTLDVQLGAPHAQSVYLAFENNRVAVVTVRLLHLGILNQPQLNLKQGIALFIVHLPPFSSDSTMARTPPVPHIRVFRIPFFLDPRQLRSVSCLQMSDTGLYLTWKPSYVDDEEVDGEMDDAYDDEDGELDPEMQENVFWESIADQTPMYISKNFFVCLLYGYLCVWI